MSNQMSLLQYFYENLETFIALTNSRIDSKKPVSLQDKVTSERLKVLQSTKGLFSKDNPLMNYGDISKRHIEIQKKFKDYEDVDISELKIRLANAELYCEVLDFILEEFCNKASFLEKKFIDAQSNQLKNSLNRQSAKNKLFDDDNKKLSECLSMVILELDGREIQSSDFLTFKRMVERTYPTPSFIPSPKLMADEKGMSDEYIEITKSIKRRTGWSSSRLRKFFEASTNVKPTTKK